MKTLQSAIAAALLTGAALLAAPANAAVVYTTVNADLSSAPYSIAFDGAAFTFSATGDWFNPLAVQTSPTAEVSAFGGFLGIPIEPTSDFVDRGYPIFGQGYGQFAGFSTATTVPYSNNGNFIGLEALEGGKSFYGFAYTNNDMLVSYGFNTVAGAAIVATTAVPEPSAWLLMATGLALSGGALRLRRRNETAFAEAV
jgi:hypothetical protein